MDIQRQVETFRIDAPGYCYSVTKILPLHEEIQRLKSRWYVDYMNAPTHVILGRDSYAILCGYVMTMINRDQKPVDLQEWRGLQILIGAKPDMIEIASIPERTI